MITGRQTLSSINSAVQQQLGKINTVEQQIEALGQRLVSLQGAQVEDYRQLAQHRVNDLATASTGQRLLGYLDDSERRVKQLLQQRRSSRETLTRDIEQADQQRAALADERTAQEDVLEALDQRLDDLEADIQQQLEADTAYQAQRERTEQAGRIARHARDKAERSKEERRDKGKAYEQDKLFNYLHQRHYGTSEYRASRLIKALDGWVAGLIGYHEARANFSRLLEIPQRLDEHATQKEQEAETEFQALQQLDAGALQAHGASELEAEQSREQDVLDDIDRRIEEGDRHYHELLERRARFAAGEDDAYQSIVKLLSAEFADDDLRELRDDALATPYPEDDIIVERLMDAEEERADIARQSRRMKTMLKEHRERLQELEATGKQFKARRYDNPRSGFSDGALVGVVLGELLNGALKSDSVWDVLTEQQRPRKRRSRPDFGSGGFGRGTPRGGSAGRNTPPRRSRPHGGFGGGGFSTGGGFGGGGGSDFRTGGDF